MPPPTRRTETSPRPNFEYRATLPETMDKDQIEANPHDGILAVRVPRTEQGRRRRIEFKAE